MSNFKEIVRNTWVFGATVIILAGSSYAMAITLKQDTHVTTVVHSAANRMQTAPSPPKSSAGYTVIDESKKLPSHPSALLQYEWQSASNNKLKAQQIDQKYRQWIANHTPSVVDMSAQQAAAYAAAIVKKAYGLNLQGYVAKAEFQNVSYINSRQWAVEFYNPKIGEKTANYACMIDAVTGNLLDLYAANSGNTEPGNQAEPPTASAENPPWVIPTAKRDISKILPKHVFITSCKIVAPHKGEFVYVVCNLSNGSAIGVCLKLTNQFAYWYHVFPNGYDGSWADY